MQNKMPYEKFSAAVMKVAEAFKKIDKKQTIRIISHLDCDGICACSILIRALSKHNRRYSLSIFQQISPINLHELSAEEYQYYVFTDLGSSSLSMIKGTLRGKTVFIIDHHDPEKISLPENFHHLNPHLFGIDGGTEISGAGVVYLFTKALDESNEDMAHIAVVGAIGDVQGKEGLCTLNKQILDDAVKNKNIGIKLDLKFFGKNTRPLHKLLEYSNDILIPGISGSESAAIQFLQQLRINPKKGKGWRKYIDLTEAEKQRLTAAIIMRRVSEKNPNDIFEDNYTLLIEKEGSPFACAKEFSTILNSCGRLEKASIGVGVCLGSKDAKKKALAARESYKREIVNAMNWYKANMDSPDVFNGDGFIIINAQDNILPSMIGTFASILARSGEVRDGTYILSMAQSIDSTTKVSIRMAGNNNGDAGLHKIAERIISKVGGESGGHCNAAGGFIQTEKEEELIKIAKLVLEHCAMEEKVE